MANTIERLKADNEALRAASSAQQQGMAAMEALQQRVRECEVYAREYEAMKLLIHKMEIEKEETLKKHEKGINEIIKRHKEEKDELLAQVD